MEDKSHYNWQWRDLQHKIQVSSVEENRNQKPMTPMSGPTKQLKCLYISSPYTPPPPFLLKSLISKSKIILIKKNFDPCS